MEDNALVVERNNMLQMLKQTDYVALKIGEGASTTQDYTEVLANRTAWRTRINEIDVELEG